MKRIAVVTAAWRYVPTGEGIADRLLMGYPREGRWRRPEMKVVSCFTGRRPEGDVSAELAREFGFAIHPTIAEALRCGGSLLAVDAVVLPREAGEDAAGDLFKQCVEVFEKDGRSVPVYIGGPLSRSFERAKWAADASARLKFPILAGSWLPLTWRLPELELPLQCRIEEALMVGVDGAEAISWHALEALQCMVERRAGGETGVRAVQTVAGDEVWKAGEQGRWSKELLSSALSRSDTPQGWSVIDGRTQDLVGNGELPKLAKNPAACLIEYAGGLRAALLMLDGAVNDFTFAARLKAPDRRVSTQFLRLPAPSAAHAAHLAAEIEEMFETGRAPIPVERSLLVSGILESCLQSRASGGKRLETPHLNVRYRAPKESRYART
jgi:hypothetical protein